VRLRGHEVRVEEEAVHRVDGGEAGGGAEGDGRRGGDEGEGGALGGGEAVEDAVGVGLVSAARGGAGGGALGGIWVEVEHD